MRKVTQDAVNALLSNNTFERDNTSVRFDFENRLTIFLFGNAIARINKKGKLEICDGGYQSATTKERLNGLPNVIVCQRKGQWFLNGKPWDGEWTEV